MKTSLVRISVILLIGFLLVSQMQARLRPRPPQRQKIIVSLIAQIWRAPRSTIGQNETTYLALLRQERSRTVQVVKLSYRALDFEADIPEDFLDLQKIHKFIAIRDKGCDESLGSIRNDLKTNKDGAQQLFIGDGEGDATRLSCFVITPEDYKWTRELKENQSELQIGYVDPDQNNNAK